MKEKQEEAGKAIKMAIKHLTKTAASDPGTAESGPGAKGKPGSGGDEDLAHYVADFLFDNSHRTDCFGPDHIAEYLATGEGGFHARVRFWYAQRLDLSHLKFIQAFRVFLVDSGFNITGLEGSSASTRVPPVPPKLKPALVIVLTPNLRPAPAHTPMQSPQYRCEDCPYDGVLQCYILPRQSSFPYPIGRRGGQRLRPWQWVSIPGTGTQKRASTTHHLPQSSSPVTCASNTKPSDTKKARDGSPAMEPGDFPFGFLMRQYNDIVSREIKALNTFGGGTAPSERKSARSMRTGPSAVRTLQARLSAEPGVHRRP